MADGKGYIKISRKLFENEFFLEQREFSRFEAWLDLIQLCAFEENNSMLIKGRIVKWGRGQTIASVRYLQQRWGWKSTKKVVCFLGLLRSQMMIETDTSQKLQRITLCKYDSYNSLGNSRETEKETVRKQSGNKIKESKEFKEKKKLKDISGEKSPVCGYAECVDFWLKTFHPGWDFSAMHGKKMKSLIKKISKSITARGHPVTSETVSNAFQVMCLKLPEWYKDKDLQTIESKYNEIIEQIKTGKTGPSTNKSSRNSASIYR